MQLNANEIRHSYCEGDIYPSYPGVLWSISLFDDGFLFWGFCRASPIWLPEALFAVSVHRLTCPCLSGTAALEEDAQILKVIEAYCTSAKTRQTLNSSEYTHTLLYSHASC